MTKDDVSFLKGWAILGVIGLHLLSEVPQLSAYQGIAFHGLVWLDEILRFSVPMFVVLSGYALAAKYFGGPVDPKDFLQKRVFKLLPLYLFWTAVIYLVVHLYAPWAGFASASNWWEIIFLGRGDYQLYFVPMIFQLYLLFPVLLVLVRKWPWQALVISLISQMGVYGVFATGNWPDQVRYFWFFSWIFYFVLGMVLAEQKEWVMALTKSGIRMFGGIGVFGIIASIGLAEIRLAAGQNVIDVTTFTTLPVVVYAGGLVCLVAMLVGMWRSKLGRGFGALVTLGEKSYLVYLSHTLVLRILAGLPSDWAGMVVPTLVVAAGLVVSEKILR